MDVDLIAIHEAAHAVVAERLGFPPAAVSVRPKLGSAGRMYHGPGTRDVEGTDRELTGFAAVALAGGVAETTFSTGRNRLVPLEAFGPTDFANAWETGNKAPEFNAIGLMQKTIWGLQAVTSGRVHDVVRAALVIKAWNLFIAGRKGRGPDMQWQTSEPFPNIAS